MEYWRHSNKCIIHASTCMDGGCDFTGCKVMRRSFTHFLICATRKRIVEVRGKRKSRGCHICKELLLMIAYHSLVRKCTNENCEVPMCLFYRRHEMMEQLALSVYSNLNLK
jgi:hypothetical protein